MSTITLCTHRARIEILASETRAGMKPLFSEWSSMTVPLSDQESLLAVLCFTTDLRILESHAHVSPCVRSHMLAEISRSIKYYPTIYVVDG